VHMLRAAPTSDVESVLEAVIFDAVHCTSAASSGQIAADSVDDDAALIWQETNTEPLRRCKVPHGDSQTGYAIKYYVCVAAKLSCTADQHYAASRNVKRLVGCRQFKAAVTRRRHPQRAAQHVHRVAEAQRITVRSRRPTSARSPSTAAGGPRCAAWQSRVGVWFRALPRTSSRRLQRHTEGLS